jgi:hypothetical protein
VAVHSGILGWTAQRGCITAPQDLVAAARDGEIVLVVDDDRLLRGIEGDAPLAAAVRSDNETAQLREQVSNLTAQIDDLHDRLVDIAEASVEVLARR